MSLAAAGQHSSLGDIPPVEFEHYHAAAIAPDPSISLNGSVAAISPKPANGLSTRRLATVGVDFVAPAQVASSSAPLAPSGVRSGRANSSQQTKHGVWPLRSAVEEHTR